MDQVLYQVSSNHNSLNELCLKQEETQSLTVKLPLQSSRKFTACVELLKTYGTVKVDVKVSKGWAVVSELLLKADVYFTKKLG